MKIIEKPWGQEEILEINDQYMLKRLTMWRNHRCSLQYHLHKTETIFVLSGELRITVGESVDNLNAKSYKSGEYITIKPNLIHRMEAKEDTVYLEASTPEVNDVVRLNDDYSRVAQ